ncbi:succinylglutamate desuccinylase/aspartoacylase family protein [Candidatus Woesearchaeota archaeon]|nr:succinylglutamate desuccinylase/aspartoacylase family protein [Candidatus Woesearchaeota archaeon]
MKIGNCKSIKGKVTRGNLELAKGYVIPIMIAQGNKEGKIIFICSGMHGNEINGIETINRLIKKLDVKKLRGTIIFAPLLNPYGFKERIRYIPFDNKDLNRSFNRKGKKTFSNIIADKFMEEIVSKCDFGMDIHDGQYNVLLPHPRVPKNNREEFCFDLGKIFGTEIVMEREAKIGTLALESFRKYNIHVITIEVGGAMRLYEDYIEETIIGIKNILIYTDMMGGVIRIPLRQFFLDDRQGYISKIEGVLDLKVSLGENVKKGQLLATVYDPLNNITKEIKSKHPGFIFSVRMNDKVDKGDKILSIMHFEGKKDFIPLNAEIIDIENIKGISNIVLIPPRLLLNFFKFINPYKKIKELTKFLR